MKYPLALFFLVISTSLFCQQSNAFQKRIFKSEAYDVPYQILLPADGKTEGLPLVYFLHGSGERGSDNNITTVHGGDLFFEHFDQYPGIYVFPQCPQDSYWSNVNIVEDTTNTRGYRFEFTLDSIPTKGMAGALDLLDYLVKRYRPDPNNINVVGLSMGGMGTYEMLWRRPDMFSNAVAICGGGHPEFVNAYAKDLKLWIAHGTADNVVPISLSEEMYNAARKADLNVEFKTYEGVGHDSWTQVFEDPTFLKWLLK